MSDTPAPEATCKPIQSTCRPRAHPMDDRVRPDDDLRATLESIGDGLIALDRHWRFVYVNAVAERILGMGRERLLGCDHWETFPGALDTPLGSEYRRAAAGETRVFDYHHAPWGRWFHIRCFPRAGGGISVLFQDITGRRAKDTAMERALAQARAVFNQMTEGLVVFDREGRLLDMNPAALAIHGLDSVKALRQPLAELLRRFELSDLDGRPLAPADWPIGRVLRGETFDSYEVRVRCRDSGRAFIASCGGTRVLGSEAEVLLAIVTLRDVTAQRAAEAELAEAKRRLDSALAATELGTWHWDVERDLVHADANLLRLFGMNEDTPALAVGAFLDRVHPDDREPLRQGIARVIARGGRLETEYRVCRPGGISAGSMPADAWSATGAAVPCSPAWRWT